MKDLKTEICIKAMARVLPLKNKITQPVQRLVTTNDPYLGQLAQVRAICCDQSLERLGDFVFFRATLSPCL